MLKQNQAPKTVTYYVKGMHCASCELLIEKKLIKQEEVEMVDASLSKGTVTIEYAKGTEIKKSYLNKLFKEEGYSFF